MPIPKRIVGKDIIFSELHNTTCNRNISRIIYVHNDVYLILQLNPSNQIVSEFSDSNPIIISNLL